MKYKYIEIESTKFKYKFHDGINVISNDDNYNFDLLSIPIRILSKFSYPNFIINNDSIDVNGFISFELEDKQKTKFEINSLHNNIVDKVWFEKNNNQLKELFNYENLPIMMYYKRGGYMERQLLCNCYDDCIIDSNVQNNFPYYNFVNENNFFMQLAIKKTENEFAEFHFNYFKQIIDEILNINFFENFHFSWHFGKLVFENCGNINNINTECYDIGITIGMLMRLYCLCLNKKGKNFIGNPCDENGIVICNYNFGERPSYSDKKWEYYNIFTKYFPNIQFIVC